MSFKKSIRFRRRRQKKELMHLEMNSLLDVLVILLVFLIKSYSTSEIELKLQKDILAPISMSVSEIHRGITIQVSKDNKLYIEDELILTAESEQDFFSEDNKEKMKNALTRFRSQIEQNAMRLPENQSSLGLVNMIMDKRLNFSYLEKIMDLSTDVGFEQFKFIVVES